VSPGGSDDQLVQLSSELEAPKLKIKELESWLSTSMEEVESLTAALVRQKQKVKRLWKENCDLSMAHEDQIELKDTEIAKLQGQLHRLPSHGNSITLDRSPISVDVLSGNEGGEETQLPTDVIPTCMSAVLNV